MAASQTLKDTQMIGAADAAQYDALYLAPPPSPLRHVLRRARGPVNRASAAIIALLLHAGLLALLISRATDARLQSEIKATDLGAGGSAITVSLGQVGDAERATAFTHTGSDVAASAATGAPAAADAPDPASKKVADPTPGDTHTPAAHAHPAPAGGLVNGGGLGSAADAGQGYDPWAQASLAPRDFTAHPTPGLWDKVARCYKGPLPAEPLTLAVTLDAEGDFKGVSPVVSAPAPGGRATAIDPTALEQAIQALSNCGPYPRLSTDLTNTMTMVVPKG